MLIRADYKYHDDLRDQSAKGETVSEDDPESDIQGDSANIVYGDGEDPVAASRERLRTQTAAGHVSGKQPRSRMRAVSTTVIKVGRGVLGLVLARLPPLSTLCVVSSGGGATVFPAPAVQLSEMIHVVKL